MNIQIALKEYLDKNPVISSAGGNFTGQDILNIIEILNNTKEDFIIFDNRGGKRFEIFIGDIVKDWINTKYFKYTYMYQLNNEQHILKDFPTHLGTFY